MSKLGMEAAAPQHEVVYVLMAPPPQPRGFCRRRAFFGLLLGTGAAFLWVRFRS